LGLSNSANGYCQKCFEKKLTRLIEHAAYAKVCAERDELRLKLDFLTADPQTQYVVSQYAQLHHQDRLKIDNLMKALMECKA